MWVMSDNFIPAFAIGFAVMFITASFIHGEGLDTCAKQHNVYECEYVAVPKEDVK
jgi:hypothetical protein